MSLTWIQCLFKEEQKVNLSYGTNGCILVKYKILVKILYEDVAWSQYLIKEKGKLKYSEKYDKHI